MCSTFFGRTSVLYKRHGGRHKLLFNYMMLFSKTLHSITFLSWKSENWAKQSEAKQNKSKRRKKTLQMSRSIDGNVTFRSRNDVTQEHSFSDLPRRRLFVHWVHKKHTGMLEYWVSPSSNINICKFVSFYLHIKLIRTDVIWISQGNWNCCFLTPFNLNRSIGVFRKIREEIGINPNISRKNQFFYLLQKICIQKNIS